MRSQTRGRSAHTFESPEVLFLPHFARTHVLKVVRTFEFKSTAKAEPEETMKMMTCMMMIMAMGPGTMVLGSNCKHNCDNGGGAVAVVAGGVAAPAAVVAGTKLMGFTAGGIAAGSTAAGMMSSAAVASGGGVAAGGTVATLQAVGATGLGALGGPAIVGIVTAGAALSYLSRW